MNFSEDIQVVDLELFDAAFPVKADEEDDVKRRFMTLFAHEASTQHGSGGEILKATNAAGETFALKRLRVAQDAASTPSAKQRRKVIGNSFNHPSGNAGSTPPSYVTEGHVTAFYEEYRTHLAVSNLRGFPKVYGFGFANENPLIVMEWVEGMTLRDAVREYRSVLDDVKALVPLETVANLGIAVLDLLERAADLDERFVHRDISPRNIMLRSDRLVPEAQLESGEFDLCLVDFGSATLQPDVYDDGSFTLNTNVWRMGTPAYAPPEMLSADVELPQGYRSSRAIDVYALASVLYELYSGHTPYATMLQGGTSPYRAKTEQEPTALEPRQPDGGLLAGILMAGLRPLQEDRPSISQFKAALQNWKRIPGQRFSGSPRSAPRNNPSIWQPEYARRLITRRAFAAVGIVAVAAVASAAIAIGSKRITPTTPSADRYRTTSSLYNGEPLYKVLDSSRAGWALATAAGEIVCKPDSSRECGALQEGLVAVFDDASQLYGYIVPDGNGSYAWRILPLFAQALGFTESSAAAQDPDTKLWGFIDASGSWIIAPRFPAAHPFRNGVAAVQSPEKPNLWGAINSDGTWAIAPGFTALGSRSERGFAIAEEQPGKWGVIDPTGAWTAQKRFARLRRISAEGAPALDAARELWGYIDSSGNWLIDPLFQDARPFYNGQAAVQDAVSQLWYFIDGEGKPVGDKAPRFWKLGDLHENLAPAQASADDDTVEFDGGNARAEFAGMRYGYVNALGEWEMKRLTNLVDTAIGPAEI